MKAILLLSMLLTSPFGLKTETLVVKTTIYCDHCRECESCGGRLEKQLSDMKGIKSVELDAEKMTVSVRYNPAKINPGQIRKAISDMGYDADDVKANPEGVKTLDGCCRPQH